MDPLANMETMDGAFIQWQVNTNIQMDRGHVIVCYTMLTAFLMPTLVMNKLLGKKIPVASKHCFIHVKQVNSNVPSITFARIQFLLMHLKFLYALQHGKPMDTTSQMRTHYVCYKKWENDASITKVKTVDEMQQAFHALNKATTNRHFFYAFNLFTIKHLLPGMTIRINSVSYVFGHDNFYRLSWFVLILYKTNATEILIKVSLTMEHNQVGGAIDHLYQLEIGTISPYSPKWKRQPYQNNTNEVEGVMHSLV